MRPYNYELDSHNKKLRKIGSKSGAEEALKVLYQWVKVDNCSYQEFKSLLVIYDEIKTKEEASNLANLMEEV